MRVENSFLPVRGVGETTERRLWERGVTHWDHFDGSEVGATRADRIREFIRDGRERLDAGDARFFADALPSGSHWRIFENFRTEACFLDIETTGLSKRRDDVTVVTVHRGGETTTLVRGDDLSRSSLSAAVGDAPLLVTFNGKSFDVPFLETALGLDLDRPHFDLRYPCRRLGHTGGLKAAERALGIERDRPDISGRDAVRLWHEYEAGDAGALETLVGYNREDAVNLAPLADAVADALHDEVFGAHEDAR